MVMQACEDLWRALADALHVSVQASRRVQAVAGGAGSGGTRAADAGLGLAA